jgi:GntR family transcriptional regulator
VLDRRQVISIDANRQPFECTNFVMRADVTALDYDMRVED